MGKAKMSTLLAAVQLWLVYRKNDGSSSPKYFPRIASLGKEAQQLLSALLD
jgi:hypothetical protein